MKTFRVLLAFILTLTLCACGDGKTDYPDRDGKDSMASTQATQTDSTNNVAPDQTTPAPTQTPTTEATVPTEPEIPDVPLDAVKEDNFANYQYVLKEVGTFNKIDRLAFSNHTPVVRTVVNGKSIDYLYSYTGELIIADGCMNYEYFGDGRTAMYAEDKTRFVNVYTSEVYLESEEITRIIQMNDRYYFAVFADYGEVYDLERGCFVEGLKVTDPTLSTIPRAIEDTVFERLDYGEYRIYLGDGSVFGEMEKISFTEIGFLREVGSDLEVYNSDCSLLATVKNARSISDMASAQANTESWRYFVTGEYKNYTVIDINGDVVLPGTFLSIPMVFGDYIVVTDSNESTSLYLGDGTKVLEDQYSNIHLASELGVFRLTTIDGEKQVYIPGCGVRSLGEYNVSGYFITDYYDSFMVVSTGEILELQKSREMQVCSMVSCDQGLIEMFGGTTLLEPDYDFVAATEEYLYVLRGDTWHVYAYDLVKV